MEFPPVGDALRRWPDDRKRPRVFHESCRFTHNHILNEGSEKSIFHISFDIFHLPSPEFVTLGEQVQLALPSRASLESGLVRPAPGAQVHFLNGEQNTWTDDK